MKNVKKLIEFSNKVVKQTKLTSNYYLCHIPPDQDSDSEIGKTGWWDVYDKDQKGYQDADERYPYFDKEDLAKIIGESGEEEEFKYYKLIQELKSIESNK